MNQSIAYLAQYTALNTILDTLAAAGTTLPYGKAAKLIGMQARSSTFFEMLGRTMDEDRAQKKPLRCSLVVRGKTGRPGPAYYERAVTHGYDLKLCGGEEAFHEMMKQLVFTTAA